jgi:hypothetical protein
MAESPEVAEHEAPAALSVDERLDPVTSVTK